MKQKRKNKKGQSDVIYFIVAVVALLILAPIMLKVVNTSLGAFSTALNTTANVDYVHTTFVNFWDWLIAIAFLVNVVLLFVFSFMVDSHPIFAVFYFISAIIAMMFSHTVVTPISTIFGMDAFSTEVLALPITDFIVSNFDLLLLGIIILTGIIMYGKFKSGESFQR